MTYHCLTRFDSQQILIFIFIYISCSFRLCLYFIYFLYSSHQHFIFLTFHFIFCFQNLRLSTLFLYVIMCHVLMVDFFLWVFHFYHRHQHARMGKLQLGQRCRRSIKADWFLEPIWWEISVLSALLSALLCFSDLIVLLSSNKNFEVEFSNLYDNIQNHRRNKNFSS